MIINWQSIYPNGTYITLVPVFTALAKKRVRPPVPIDADGVYFKIDLGGGLIYLKRVK
jgi:hypothetical protein